MFSKVYTCETINGNGDIIGSRICSISWWCNAKVAFDILLDSLPENICIVNFRRVK